MKIDFDDELEARPNNFILADEIMQSRRGKVTTIADLCYIMELEESRMGQILNLLVKDGKLVRQDIENKLYYCLSSEKHLLDKVERTDKKTGLKPSDFPYLDSIIATYNIKPLDVAV